MFFRFSLTGMAAIVTIVGVVAWRELTAPVPATPCPPVTLEAIAARGQSFPRSFLAAGDDTDILVRAVTGTTGKGNPACLELIGRARCQATGATTIGISAYGTVAFHDIPAGMRAEITVSERDGVACGMESVAAGSS